MGSKELEEESRMYDAGYTAGQASVQTKYMEFRHIYIDALHVLISRATAKGEYESVVYARQLLRSLK
jgi:hypothetical protein